MGGELVVGDYVFVVCIVFVGSAKLGGGILVGGEEGKPTVAYFAPLRPALEVVPVGGQSVAGLRSKCVASLSPAP